MSSKSTRRNIKLAPEVNRILFVKNLPFNIKNDEMYDIFGKFGPIRQIRLGNERNTKGTAFVIYVDVFDAKNAVDHLIGFNVGGRYLVVLYYNQTKMMEKIQITRRKKELDKFKQQQLTN